MDDAPQKAFREGIPGVAAGKIGRFWSFLSTFGADFLKMFGN